MEKGTMKNAATLSAQTGLEGPLPACGYVKGKLEASVRTMLPDTTLRISRELDRRTSRHCHGRTRSIVSHGLSVESVGLTVCFPCGLGGQSHRFGG
jgi:hypothetical protein